MKHLYKKKILNKTKQKQDRKNRKRQEHREGEAQEQAELLGDQRPVVELNPCDTNYTRDELEHHLI